MKKHFAKLLLLGAMIVAGFSFVACNDIENEMAELDQKIENLESATAKNLQDAINALNAKLASDYALKTDVSALEVALKGEIATQVAAAEVKINKAIDDAIAACKAENAAAVAKVAGDLAKVSEELDAIAADVAAATSKIDENATAIAGVDAKVLELKATIDSLSEYLEGIEAMVKENNATLLSLAEHLEAREAEVDMKLTELNGSLVALSAYLEELEASINARFAEHANTFASLSIFLEQHEVEVDAKFAEILATLESLSPVIEKMDAQIKENNATLESLAPVIETLEAKIAEISAALESLSPVIEKMDAQIKENNATLESLSKFLEEADYQAQIDSLEATVKANVALLEAIETADYQGQIDALVAQLKALSEGQVDVDAVKAMVEAAINEVLDTLTGRVGTLENRLQSVSFVPEWTTGPKAVKFEENKDYGFVVMSFEVAPKAYATKLTTENTMLVGLPLKAAKVDQFDVQILSANETTGIVEVIGYIDEDSKIWKAEMASLALRVVAEDAQVTSSYVNVAVLDHGTPKSFNSAVYFGAYNEEGKFVTNSNDGTNTDLNTLLTYSLPFDTAVAESEVALFEGLDARVYVEGFMDYITVEQATQLLGINLEDVKIETVTKKYATDFYVTNNPKLYNLTGDEEAEEEDYTPAFTVANDKTLDVTVKFNKDVVDSLVKVENGLKTYFDGKSATVTLKDGFYTVGGKKAVNFVKGAVATYQVGKPQTTETLIVNSGNALAIEWSTKDAAKTTWNFKDLDVTGGNAREVLGTPCTMSLLDKDGKVVTDPTVIAANPAVEVTFISIDNADVTVSNVKWPEEETTYNYTYKKVAPADDNGVVVTTTFNLSVTVGTAPEAIGEVSVSKAVAVTLTENDELLKDPSELTTEVALNGVVEALLPYYKDYYKTEKEAKAAIETAVNCAAVTVKVDNNGELVAQTITATYNYVAAQPTATPATPEASFIEIAYDETVYDTMSENYVQFSFDVEIYGVKATVTADCAKVAKWTKKTYSPATAKVVSGRLVPEFYGKQVFALGSMPESVMNGTTLLGTYYYDVPSVIGNSYDYELDKTFKFGDYVDFEIAEDDVNTYYVVWQVKAQPNVTHTGAGTTADQHVLNTVIPTISVSSTDFEIKAGSTATAPTTVVNNAFTANNFPVKGWSQPHKLTGNGNDRATFDAITLDWNNSEVGQFAIDFKLVTYDSVNAKYVDVAGSAKTITFKTKRAISSVATSNVEIKWNAMDPAKMTANVATGVEVKDLYNVVINNKGADRTLYNYWSGYSVDKNATKNAGAPYAAIYVTDATVSGSTDLYNQSIDLVQFDIDDVVTTTTPGFIKAPKGYTSDDYTFVTDSSSEDYGKFTFHPNTEPATDVTFTVHVKVAHDNAYGQAGLEQEVTITIKK